MLGAIAGDMIGSTFEQCPVKTIDFPLFRPGSRFTDDTVMTVATASALLTDGDFAAHYRRLGLRYPKAGYGGRFRQWLEDWNLGPYQSWANGSAMRVSPVGWACNSADEVLEVAARSAAVTHDHPDGIAGAQAVALAVFLARTGTDKPRIKRALSERFGYDLDRTTAGIRPDYGFELSCGKSVPQSLVCFLEADDWLGAVRLAISLGGDADTMACIAGAVAEAFYGCVPAEIAQQARPMLPDSLAAIVTEFETRYR